MEENHAFKYAAFISYRHLPRDKEVAQEVQRAIEDYKIPKNVRLLHEGNSRQQATSSRSEAETSRPHAENSHASPIATGEPRTLGKCFRDEDELVASHSLPENICRALEQSQCLIVICTPDTSESPWVQREIKEFMRLRGREHIIAVLASGSSAESIPDILKRKPVVAPDGTISEIPTEPLAADLRLESASHRKAELLRLIASVVGCEYDDLRQRTRRRRRQRQAIAAICAIALIAVIAALLIWALAPSEDQLIAESRDLAAQSQQQFAQGDRMKAIETALDALPTSLESPDRPLVPEAQDALEAAVQFNPVPEQGEWHPSFLLETPGNIASFTTSPNGSWAAILDDARTISVFNLITGTPRFSIDLTQYEESSESETNSIANEWAVIAAGSDRLIIAKRTDAATLACFDAMTGELLWEHENATINSYALSENGEGMAITALLEDNMLLSALIDTATGETLAFAQTECPDISDYTIFFPSTLDSESFHAYVGVNGLVGDADFEAGEFGFFDVTKQTIFSINNDSDTVVVGSVGSNKLDNEDTLPYSVTCVKNKKKLWEITGTFENYYVGSTSLEASMMPYPQIREFINFRDKRAVVVTVGNEIKILQLSDGAELYSKTFSSACVGENARWSGGDYYLLFTAIAEGVLNVIHVDYDTKSDVGRTTLPYAVEEVLFEWYSDAYLALARTAVPSNHLLVYHFDSRSEEKTIEVPLDVIIAEAQEMLKVYETAEGQTSIIHNPHMYTYTGLPNES